MKDKKRILKHIAAILVLLVFAVLAIGSTESTPSVYSGYSYSGSGSGSSYGKGTGTTNTLSGTYRDSNNFQSMTFYTDGTWDYDSSFGIYSYGTYSVSGTRIRMYEEHSGDVLYCTIVDSTTIRDFTGTLFRK